MATRPRPSALVPLLLLGCLGPADAQIYPNRYEQIYGDPIDVSLSDLAFGGSAYEGRAVRTRGRVDLRPGVQRSYVLKDSFGALLITPVPDIASEWASEAPRLLGSEIEVTGVFRSLSSDSQAMMTASATGAIDFWSYLKRDRDEDKKKLDRAETVTLETLVTRADRMQGRIVRVGGHFRGRNLFGDLPSASQRSRSDWVIWNDLYAAWVVGKKPQGSGWRLDASLKRDAGRWIDVVGRVEARGGVVYIQAEEVSLGTEPPNVDANAKEAAEPKPAAPERPKQPPIVVFALPLDGDDAVPPETRFLVQFSNDMDEKTFPGHVVLRYVGRPMPGDRSLDAVSLTYDAGRKALTVDPGDLLRGGRQIEILLLPGIADIQGLPLTGREGRPSGVAVDVLRYRIAG
jgi:hypothetical protein